MTSLDDRRASVNGLPLSGLAGAAKNRGIWVEIGSNIECDLGGGERYDIENSPGKLPSIEQCKKSCGYSVECLSITYLNTGWCSHYSTPCTNHKSNNKAVSMRWDTSGLFLVCSVISYVRSKVNMMRAARAFAPKHSWSCTPIQHYITQSGVYRKRLRSKIFKRYE